MYLYAACGDELRCLPVVSTLGSLDTEVAFRWEKAADMVRFAFSSEKCIYAIDSLEFSLPPSLFLPNSQAHRLGLGRSSLNPCLSLPSIHPSLLPSSLPSPRTVCSNSEGSEARMLREAPGWGGGRSGPPRLPKPCFRVCLEWILPHNLPPPRAFPLHPERCGCAGGRQQCRLGGTGARMQL